MVRSELEGGGGGWTPSLSNRRVAPRGAAHLDGDTRAPLPRLLRVRTLDEHEAGQSRNRRAAKQGSGLPLELTPQSKVYSLSRRRAATHGRVRSPYTSPPTNTPPPDASAPEEDELGEPRTRRAEQGWWASSPSLSSLPTRAQSSRRAAPPRIECHPRATWAHPRGTTPLQPGPPRVPKVRRRAASVSPRRGCGRKKEPGAHPRGIRDPGDLDREP